MKERIEVLEAELKDRKNAETTPAPAAAAPMPQPVPPAIPEALQAPETGPSPDTQTQQVQTQRATQPVGIRLPERRVDLLRVLLLVSDHS